ncbi:MAG: Gfo/Idh/MocA family protein [Armatimonadota bacterium]
MARLRIGILGCGGIANAHARTLLNLSHRAELAAFCDVVQERAEQFSRQYTDGKGLVFTSHHDMYEKADLDVVWICLPPFAHTDDVEAAASKGIHVFIEKPIALTMEKANSMVEAVRQHGVKSQVGFMSRFGEAVQLVKRMLQDGTAGAPGLMVGKYYCNALHAPWWRDKSKSGGQVVEQIIHTFDLTRFFLGEVESVFCRMRNLFHKDVENFTSEDVSGTVITFRSGAIATVSGTDGAIPGQWINQYELVAKNLTVYFSDANNATIHFTDKPWPLKSVVSAEKHLFQAEAEDLLNAIESGGPTAVPMEEGAKTLELVLAASRSGETGEVVTL